MQALRRLGVRVEGIDVTVSEFVEFAAKVASIAPQRSVWRERYRFSPVRRATMSASGAYRVRTLKQRPDATLQVGGYFRLDGRFAASPAPLRCAYHDSCLPLLLRDGVGIGIENPQRAHIRRELHAERRIFDGLDLALTMSNWVKQFLVEHFGQPDDKVVVVGRGVNLETLPAPAAAIRDWETPRILFVGFDFNRKGGETLLEAFRILRARLPHAQLSIAGPSEPPGIDERGVRWHSSIDRGTPNGADQFDRLLQEATMFVLPSYFDPTPGVMLEAMAYEVPCVGTRVCGIPEMIDEGRTGLLVPPYDPERLADAMHELAVDPRRSRTMGETARKRIEEKFTWDTVAANVVEAIEQRLP